MHSVCMYSVRIAGVSVKFPRLMRILLLFQALKIDIRHFDDHSTSSYYRRNLRVLDCILKVAAGLAITIPKIM